MPVQPLQRVFLLLLLAGVMGSCRNNKALIKDEADGNESIRNKYAVILGVDAQLITNTTLYMVIDHWLGVPYKYGGKDKNGIDCSGLTAVVMKESFQKEVSGPSWSIAEQCATVSAKELKEGDLVFFTISGSKISHVGIYLQNGHFLHASTSRGVMISDLSEAYYSKYFTNGGRYP